MDDDGDLAEGMLCEKVVEEGNHAIGPLAHVHPLVYEVVDLLLTVCTSTVSNAGKIISLVVVWPRSISQKCHTSSVQGNRWGLAAGGCVECEPKVQRSFFKKELGQSFTCCAKSNEKCTVMLLLQAGREEPSGGTEVDWKILSSSCFDSSTWLRR